jgi:hypothetical protein
MTGTLLCTGALSGCGGPLAGLSADDRRFLFADSQSDAAFMGKPHDGGLPGCDPDRMDQAFVLVDTRSGLWLDSVRPTGVERHKVVRVERPEPGTFDVTGQNGAEMPFTLHIVRSGNAIVEISWDGAEPSTFLRCEKAAARS